MRKDVKLGFTIGGILLAVLIAYVLVVPERDPSDVQLVDADGNPIVTPTTPPIHVGADDGDEGSESMETVGANGQLVPPTADDGDASAEPTSPKVVANANESIAEVTGAVASTATPAAPTNADVDWEALLGGGEVLMTRTPETTPNQAVAPLPPTEPESVVNADEITPADLNPPASDTPANETPITRPMVGGTRTHVVQSGETLSSISKAAYGSANYYPHILRANPGLEPSRMKVGTTITLPDISDVVPVAGGTASADRTLDSTTEYRVRSGDSLYSISTKLYGSPARMSELYELNKPTIGADPSKLKLDMILKLPAPPAETASR